MMDWKQSFMTSMDELTYNRFFYYYNHLKKAQIPKRLDLRNPVTFNEKTIWLKMNKRYSNADVLTDKVKVKDFVRHEIGESYLIPTLAVFNNVSQINFEKLPSSFVLKANHGSGWNVICRDKDKLDLIGTKSKLTKWCTTNYYDIGKEYQYRDIIPRILCEVYFRDSEETALIDYKVFCFSGKAMFVQVDLDRFTHHSRNFYDTEWNLMPFTTMYPLGRKKLNRPHRLDEMIVIAETLSKRLTFARIDLYYYQGKVYFGEITLHHGGGFEPFMPAKYDRILGEYITLA